MIINLIFWEFRPVFETEIHLEGGTIIRERFVRLEWKRNNRINELNWTRYDGGVGLSYIHLDSIAAIVTKKIYYRFIRKQKK